MKKNLKQGKAGSKTKPETEKDTMRPEYDFSKAQRGTTAARYAQGTNVVVLDQDVVRMFPTADAVNEALRALVEIIRKCPDPERNEKQSS